MNSRRLTFLNRSISPTSAVETSGLQVLAGWISSEPSAANAVGFRKDDKGALFYLYHLDFYKGDFPQWVVTLFLEKFWNQTHEYISWLNETQKHMWSTRETSILPLLSAQVGAARMHCFLHICNIDSYRQSQSIVETFFFQSKSLESENAHWSQL